MCNCVKGKVHVILILYFTNIMKRPKAAFCAKPLLYIKVELELELAQLLTEGRLRTPGEEIAFTALHGRKLTLTPKFLCTAEAYFVCHIGPSFQISTIYDFIWCP